MKSSVVVLFPIQHSKEDILDLSPYLNFNQVGVHRAAFGIHILKERILFFDLIYIYIPDVQFFKGTSPVCVGGSSLAHIMLM